MKVKLKHIIGLIVLMLLASIITILLPIAYVYIAIFDESYTKRDPQNLIAEIETLCEIDFPDEISNLSAGHIGHGGLQDSDMVSLLLEFTAEPEVADNFFRTLIDTDMWEECKISKGMNTQISFPLEGPGLDVYLDISIYISDKDIYKTQIEAVYRERDVPPDMMKKIKKSRIKIKEKSV